MGQSRRPDRRRGGGGGGRPGGRGRGGGGAGSFHGARLGNPQHSEPQSESRDSPMEDSAHDAPATTVQPPLAEPVPLDTPTFASLTGSSLVHPIMIQTITEDMKFDHMMPVQAATLTELLPPNRSDCLVQAKTGTGKTIAFLLPALQNMITNGRLSNDRGISLLVISPTRELAMQIAQEAKRLLQRLPQYRVCVAIGGTNKDREEKQILSGCDLCIATPGRLLDHMGDERITWALRHLDTLVLDEADRLLDMGFMPALKDIVGRLPNKQDTNRQGMLFSATVPSHVEKVAGLVLSPGYKFISTIPPDEASTHERVPQLLVTVPSFSSVAAAVVGSIREESAIVRAAGQSFKAIVFAPTAAHADYYGHVLSEIRDLAPVSILHARISQSRRTKATDAYRNASTGILVATDVVARGMDFPGVTTVFQVGIPADKQSYIHRLGRTARAGAEGRGIFVVAEAESWFPRWSLKEVSLTQHQPDLSSAAEVTAISEKMEEQQKAKIYQAWLGFYKSHLKSFKWTPEELVAQGNLYARQGLGSPDTPPIGKSTSSKMGLKGVKGLYIVPDAPKPGGNDGGRGKRGGGGGGGGGGRGRGRGRA